MNETIKLTVALTIVCLFSGLVIAFTHSSIIQKIEAQGTLEQRRAVESVFPAGVTIFDTAAPPPLPARFWCARKGPVAVGRAFLLESNGFAGAIRFIVGIDTQGVITGVKILAQNETPGLGARIEERLKGRLLWTAFKADPGNDLPWFPRQFKGLSVRKQLSISSVGEWPGLSEREKQSLVDDNSVSSITGATVSTRAIVDGIVKIAVLSGERRQP